MTPFHSHLQVFHQSILIWIWSKFVILIFICKFMFLPLLRSFKSGCSFISFAFVSISVFQRFTINGIYAIYTIRDIAVYHKKKRISSLPVVCNMLTIMCPCSKAILIWIVNLATNFKLACYHEIYVDLKTNILNFILFYPINDNVSI